MKKIINTLVVKIASRCNINCTYCYMYNHEDQSYKLQPKFISKKTIFDLTKRIENHCIKHAITHFNIIFHGGEPLLTDLSYFRWILTEINSLKKHRINIHFYVQSNGMLISKEYCALFNEFNVKIGISLDGVKEIHDLHRLDKKGQGTYNRVVHGIEIADQYMNHDLGSLSVLNLKSNPIETYNTYRALNFKTIDFLLLDENYDSFPQIEETLTKLQNSDWLITLFDYWYAEKDNHRLYLRKFENIISLLFNNHEQYETIQDQKNSVAVIETNGNIEPLDVLKICGESFTKTIFSVHDNELDAIFENDLIDLYYDGNSLLPKKCLACPVMEVCGGGYFPHRYSSTNGFNNPSIYCNDLLKLITHIQCTIVDSIPEELRQEIGIEKLSYEKALEIIEETLPTISEPYYIERLENYRKKEDATI